MRNTTCSFLSSFPEMESMIELVVICAIVVKIFVSVKVVKSFELCKRRYYYNIFMVYLSYVYSMFILYLRYIYSML